MYGYLWEYTIAQIELLSIDQPIVTYRNDKDKKNRKPKATDVLKREIEWREQYGGSNKFKDITFDLKDYTLNKE